MNDDWFRKSTEEVVSTLETDIERGLNRETAEARLLELGPNELKKGEKISPLRLFL
jgi:Ca2+-transporting ATPase